MQLGPEYYDLCRNNNATHFIQKVVKTFPLEYTIAYFAYTVENLLSFALDKNAMCAINHMMIGDDQAGFCVQNYTRASALFGHWLTALRQVEGWP